MFSKRQKVCFGVGEHSKTKTNKKQKSQTLGHSHITAQLLNLAVIIITTLIMIMLPIGMEGGRLLSSAGSPAHKGGYILYLKLFFADALVSAPLSSTMRHALMRFTCGNRTTITCACIAHKYAIPLGGTTWLTLLVSYGLVYFLRQYLSNTAS